MLLLRPPADEVSEGVRSWEGREFTGGVRIIASGSAGTWLRTRSFSTIAMPCFTASVDNSIMHTEYDAYDFYEDWAGQTLFPAFVALVLVTLHLL